ncbi:DUF7255 family protein [Sphingobacterium daejeonense]|uniref:DUF7255 family protein n=1 Tax=Sphingobacterium daejeonense TaxID=371142 RepID=UPI003D31F77A
MYKKLGGIQIDIPFNYRKWDISTDSFTIELDEELHFNRYRLSTLNSKIYTQSPLRNILDIHNYMAHCVNYEGNCLKAGGYSGKWKNDSTEKQFLRSNAFGNLEGNGSSRWKQRAFYDFAKDISSLFINVPFYRISIYENFNGLSIGDILDNENEYLLLNYLKIRLKLKL